jgi:hypothetical protein
MRSADVECAKSRSRVLALGTENAARRHFIRLAEKLDEDHHAVDLPRPPKARLLLLEVRLLHVVLESAVCLWRLVAEGQADHKIDIRRSDMAPCTFRKSPHDVLRCEASRKVDAFSPGPEVAEQGHQGTFASPRCFLVIVSVVLAATQNPITSRRRWSACSRPRRGSVRRSP